VAKIEQVTRLKAPVGDVFAYIADFRTIKDYNPSILQVKRLSDGPPAKGDRYELTLSTFGIKLRPVLTITEIRENELIATRLDAFIPANEKRIFKQEGNETDFFFTIEFSCGWPLIGPLIDILLVSLIARRQADMEVRLLEKHFNLEDDR
jgi:hypothetical protein